MLAILLAAVVGQSPLLPPLLPDPDSKADVATIGYLAELEAFNARVQRRQREIDTEPDERRREVLRADLDAYQRDVLPMLDEIRQAVERLRAKEERLPLAVGDLDPCRRICLHPPIGSGNFRPAVLPWCYPLVKNSENRR